jgi:hypothetical protein
MIRGPVLPQARARLWELVQSRFSIIEHGLELVHEALDCAEGQYGLIDGLCRDAGGAPVLVALALEGDAMLLPRIVAAADFLDRAGPSLADAVAEGHFCCGAAPRLLVIGGESAAAQLAALARLGLPRLERCRLEPFRLAGSERIAVRWLDRAAVPDADGAPAAAAAPAADAAEFGADAPLWQHVVGLCRRIDPGVGIDGGRFDRRISWRGRMLARVVYTDGGLRATIAGAGELALTAKSDLRQFGDRLLRRFAEVAGLRAAAFASPPALESPGVPADERRLTRELPRDDLPSRADLLPRAATREEPRNGARSVVSLRSALADALLSPEELAALTAPADTGRIDDPPD